MPADNEQSQQVAHTPGPWSVFEEDGVFLIKHAGGWILDSDSEDQDRADAQLMAAAPDLLAALIKIRAELCRRHSAFVVRDQYGYINLAIEKAVGSV